MHLMNDLYFSVLGYWLTTFVQSTLKCPFPSFCKVQSGNLKIGYLASTIIKNEHMVDAKSKWNKRFSVLGTKDEKEKKCWMLCYQQRPNCKSASLSPFGLESACYLSSANSYVYQVSHRLGWIRMEIVHYGCEQNPCKGGICIPNYDDGSFRCRCNKWKIGKFCEKTDWKSHVDGYWNFDNGVIRNEGVDTNLVDVNGTGKITYEPGKYTKVMHCAREGCFTVAKNGACIRSGAAYGQHNCSKGFTLAFWFRALNPDYNTQQVYVGKRMHGLCISQEHGRWMIVYNEKEKTFRCIDIFPRYQGYRKWTHVVVRFDRSGIKCFINGIQHQTTEIHSRDYPLILSGFNFADSSVLWYVDDIVFMGGQIPDDMIKMIYKDTKDN